MEPKAKSPPKPAPPPAAAAAPILKLEINPDRSPLLYILSWQDATLTLSLLLPGLALLVSHTLLGYSIASAALYLASAGLLTGAALSLWNHSGLGPQFRQPQIPLTASGVAVTLGALGQRLGGGVAAYNALLTWQAPLDSVRALLYCVLACQLQWLLAPRCLIGGYLAAFALVPIYLRQGRAAWLRVRGEAIGPACKRLAAGAAAQAEYVQQSGALGKGVGVITAALVVYVLSEYMSGLQIVTVVCCVQCISDLVLLLAKAKDD